MQKNIIENIVRTKYLDQIEDTDAAAAAK